MDSFGIVDFALPFGAVALALLCWVVVGRIDGRKARTREVPAAERARDGGAEVRRKKGEVRRK